MKHKWEKMILLPNEKHILSSKYICTNGDCKCLKLVYPYSGIVSYQRGLQIYSDAPECYGKIPLNEQKID